MNRWVIASGLLAGLGCSLTIGEMWPAAPSLFAALNRLDGHAPAASPHPHTGLAGRLGLRVATTMPWLPVPAADLRLLGQNPGDWLAGKVIWGIVGSSVVPVAAAALAISGWSVAWPTPVGGMLAAGLAMFFVPDIVTRMTARRRRTDFRYALTSYLDLVALERGAGAGPTEALEAAANVGTGWAFARIAASLDQARRAGRPPWDGLAQLAADTGIDELADVADIAGVAGQEGARILDTLSARAESMRAEALAATRARSSARSTTMVLPIAMLAGGFLVLLIFPDFYRLFG
ncbi:MAG: type II secretion system F family protein [Streptosporangiaceae bacterium]